jgi:hypothetical protein
MVADNLIHFSFTDTPACSCASGETTSITNYNGTQILQPHKTGSSISLAFCIVIFNSRIVTVYLLLL